MTSLIHRCQRVPVLLLASLSFCQAQPEPPTAVDFLFAGSAAPVYDLTGSYRFDQQVQLADGLVATLSLSLSVRQDAAGRLQGTGSTTVLIGDNAYPASYVVSGRVSGGSEVTRAVLAARLRTQDDGAGVNPSGAVSIQYNLLVSPQGLNGTARGTAKFAGLGTGRISSRLAGVPLPPGVDGSWSVQMNIVRQGRLHGTGSILLSNGRTLQASLTGSSALASGLDRVNLSGASGDRGNKLNLSFFAQTRSLQKLSGKILGQTVYGAPASAQYVGSQACIECHGPMYQAQTNTFHGQLGVQCESCHGPAASHAANSYDPLVRPRVDLTSTACGACHSGLQHPIYEEWSASAHAKVIADLDSTNRISRCAPCHSGSVRVSLLTGIPLPAGGAAVPISCPTCHETHQDTPNPALLRNPVSSTNDFFLNPTDSFTNQYDPQINLCGQCHNHGGAAWTDTAYAPHYSPQYNFLLGNIGELATGPVTNYPAAHAGLPDSAQYSTSGTFYLTNQCVSCHMQDNAAPVEQASHRFTVGAYDLCLNCHPGVEPPELLMQWLAVPAISNRVYRLKYGLDLWANTKAPAVLQTNGVLAWEYSNPGGLTWQTNNGVVSWIVADQVNFVGPDAAGQTWIPDTIKKARFDLYLVLRDGSWSIHNPYLALELLETAAGWVGEELNK
jgi:hypothetical protein